MNGRNCAIFATAALGLGLEATECVAQTFHDAASNYSAVGETAMNAAIAISVAGLTVLSIYGPVLLALMIGKRMDKSQEPKNAEVIKHTGQPSP